VRTRHAAFLLLSWLLAATAVLAQDVLSASTLHTAPPNPPIPLSSGDAPITLDGNARYWVDATGQATIDEVVASGDALPWAPRERGQQHRIDAKALWFQFQTHSRDNGRWYVEVSSSGLDRAQLFYRGPSGAWVVQEAGDTQPVSRWPLPGRVPTFELTPSSSEPVSYWLRIEHARVDFAAPITLYSQARLLAARESEQFLLGAYFGLAMLVMLVAAGNAWSFRDKAFGTYAIYVFALGIGQLAYLGVGAQHVWDTWLEWNKVSTSILPGLSACVGMWFVKTVTEPARFSRLLDRTVWAMIVLLLAALVLDTIVNTRASFALLMGLTAASIAVVVLLIGVVWMRGDDPHIRLIALGFLPVVLMAMFPVARGMNLIPNSLFTRYGLTIGAALEMPILFYALSMRGARRREAQIRAAALSDSDPLTGLAHSRTLVQRLGAALNRARTQKHQCALLGVKLSNHEAIASELGRDAAERALVVAASALRHAIGDVDLAARVGERDFALLLEGPVSTAAAVASAQLLIAKGLQQSPSLPNHLFLRFHIAVAMLPDKDMDATASLAWVLDGVNAIRPDARRAIRPLNF
jgi:diguanylate cyclase (GGDEF)-like protein